MFDFRFNFKIIATAEGDANSEFFSLLLFRLLKTSRSPEKRTPDRRLPYPRLAITRKFVARLTLFLFEWKWILIGLRGFIDLFWQNSFAPKSRYDVENRLRALITEYLRREVQREQIINLSFCNTTGQNKFA